MNVGIGISPFFGVKDLGDVQSYIARVLADSGEVANSAKLRELILMLKAQGLYDSTKLLIAPVLGGKWRTSGIYKYASKLYSVNLAANDATQTAEVSQPYQSGNIAPTELLSIKNPNGDARYLSHPAISFAANEAWSVSWVINWNYDAVGFLHHNGIDTNNRIYLRTGGLSQYLGFNNSVGGAYTFNLVSHLYFIGKNRMLTMVSDGAGSVKVYIDSVLIQEVTGVTASISFVSLLRGVTFNYAGTSHYYRIQSGAMTAGQITAEYNLLRSWIPEIDSVQIGTQTWATSNLAAVATPLGNVIPEVQTAGAVEKVTNAADREFSSDTGFWTKGAGVTIGGGVCDVNSAISSVLLKVSFLTVGKYYKITYRLVSRTSGRVGMSSLSSATVYNSTPGVYTYIGTADQTTLEFYCPDASNVLQIDDVSVQELNWSNATEIYQAVYDATSGDAATKHYAAVKEAAMWCHYDNSTANGAVYNKLYNWYAASLFDLDMASAGYGWRVPTSAQFTALANALGGAAVAGGKMKMTGTNYWNSPNTGATNESLFSAIGAGYRDQLGVFSNIKVYNGLWAITEYNAASSYLGELKNELSSFTLNAYLSSQKNRGFSIRLIKNT